MTLTHEQLEAFKLTHESLVAQMTQQGLELDYSVESLKDVEALCGGFRLLREEEPDRAESVARGFQTMAGAYVAEVFRRAVPGSELSWTDGELVVMLPSRCEPKGRFKVVPGIRVGKLLRRQETLYWWATFFVAMAGYEPAVNPAPTGGALPASGPGHRVIERISVVLE